MIESEMGDLQDALANLIPQSAIPTFDEMAEWSDVDAQKVRAWIDGGGRGPTPEVFWDAIARYHAPRPSDSVRVPEEFYETQRILAGNGDARDLDMMDWTAPPKETQP